MKGSKAGCGDGRGASAKTDAIADITYVDAFMREAWRYGGAFFFCVTKEDRKFLDRGHGNVSAVVSG